MRLKAIIIRAGLKWALGSVGDVVKWLQLGGEGEVGTWSMKIYFHRSGDFSG